MKPGLILLLALFFIGNHSFGQDTKGMIDINCSLNYAFLGEGDFSGIYYTNSILYSFSSGFQISGTLGFLNSSNSGKENILYSHNDTHLTGDIILKINPIEFGKFNLYFAFGGSVRHRSEIRVNTLETIDGKLYPGYNNSVSTDIGYTGQTGIGYKISPRILLILNGAIHAYNNGTGVSSIGLGVDIDL